MTNANSTRSLPAADTALDRASRNGLNLFTVYIFVLFAIPSRLIFAPLGGAGTPAQVLSLGLGLSWAASRVYSGRQTRVSDPVRTFMGLFVLAVLASYVVAETRPLSGVELRAADTALLVAMAWMSLYLFMTDRMADREVIIHALRRVVLAVSLVGTLGVIQFITHRPWTDLIQIPGLSVNTAVVGVFDRSGFTRPAGTTIHPLEFGAIMTMVLPIALHFAMTDTHRKLLGRWLPVAVIAAAVPISISRSAILSTFVVLLCLFPTWTKKQRRGAYFATVAALGFFFVTVPGLLGTITNLFTSISGDSSALSRSNSYSIAAEFIAKEPVFGRGFGTFLPAYHILDNQYLGLLIETGIVGLTCYLGILVSGIVVTRRIRRSDPSPVIRSLTFALAAAVASGGASFALFDAFSFPMSASTLILIVGAISALYRGTQLELRAGDGATRVAAERIHSLDT